MYLGLVFLWATHSRTLGLLQTQILVVIRHSLLIACTSVHHIILIPLLKTNAFAVLFRD